MITRLFRIARFEIASLNKPNPRSVVFSHTESNQGYRYSVYRGKNWQGALKFLRSFEVKERNMYVIVETPEGNIGKDLISIFDERNSKTLELGIRKPFLKLKKSDTHCSCCGYFVLKAGKTQIPAQAGWYIEMFSLDDMQEKGLGFFCDKCRSVVCAFCVTLKDKKCPCPFCGEVMDTHT